MLNLNCILQVILLPGKRSLYSSPYSLFLTSALKLWADIRTCNILEIVNLLQRNVEPDRVRANNVPRPGFSTVNQETKMGEVAEMILEDVYK